MQRENGADASKGGAWVSLRNRILRACTELSVSSCSGVHDAFVQGLLSLTPPVRVVFGSSVLLDCVVCTCCDNRHTACMKG